VFTSNINTEMSAWLNRIVWNIFICRFNDVQK